MATPGTRRARPAAQAQDAAAGSQQRPGRGGRRAGAGDTAPGRHRERRITANGHGHDGLHRRDRGGASPAGRGRRPATTLPVRDGAALGDPALARNAGNGHRGVLAVYGDLTQLVGWLMFSLGDRSAARYYYDDARSAADRAAHPDLVAYALSASSQLALAQGDPRDAIDPRTRRGRQHAVAAPRSRGVRGRCYCPRLRRRWPGGRCQAALDREHAALGEIGPATPRAPWWDSLRRCLLLRDRERMRAPAGMAVKASDAASRSLA